MWSKNINKYKCGVKFNLFKKSIILFILYFLFSNNSRDPKDHKCDTNIQSRYHSNKKKLIVDLEDVYHRTKSHAIWTKNTFFFFNSANVVCGSKSPRRTHKGLKHVLCNNFKLKVLKIF